MARIRVGIDFDSTIAQLADPWLRRFNAQKGTRYHPSDWKDWELTFLKPEDRPLFFSLLTPELYDHVLPYKHAPKVISEWSERRDLELLCVTTNPSVNSGKFLDAKRRWLEKHVPALKDSLIAARRKSGLGLDILIDDAPHHHVDGDYVSILVRQPWNDLVSCECCFRDWKDANAALTRAIKQVRRSVPPRAGSTRHDDHAALVRKHA